MKPGIKFEVIGIFNGKAHYSVAFVASSGEKQVVTFGEDTLEEMKDDFKFKNDNLLAD